MHFVWRQLALQVVRLVVLQSQGSQGTAGSAPAAWAPCLKSLLLPSPARMFRSRWVE